jgi:hypothetical protein
MPPAISPVRDLPTPAPPAVRHQAVAAWAGPAGRPLSRRGVRRCASSGCAGH